MHNESSAILAVDDNPANLGFLFDLLDEKGKVEPRIHFKAKHF